ncbi:MAG: hypothetical protein SFU56_16140 [Capsulimonadales bacterium]|nr:hypothetical protein [Capsulimonadales bacterium]
MSPQDIASIGTLMLLEGLLSADNALVLALIARRLPDERQRNTALNIGIMLSFLFRAVGLLFASLIIKFWFMRAAGGAYLLYLAGNHFREKLQGGHPETGSETVAKEGGEPTVSAEGASPERPDKADKVEFRKVVIALALTDVAFAVDSILAAVALTNKLWVIYLGVILGIIALRLVATAFIKLLEKYPAFADTAYLLVAWAGLKLSLEAIESFGHSIHRPMPIALPDFVFWIGMGLIVTIGTFVALRRPATPPASPTSH